MRNQIVCIDDLERIGEGLTTKNVLGLVSYLKEQRRCKVVLLLNDKELKGEQSSEFKKQLEKVIDVEMYFEPTPNEAVEIGTDPATQFQEKLKEICVSLHITNIRVIRKIERLAKRLHELLATFDKSVFDASLVSVILFGWMNYEQNQAPKIEYIKKFSVFGPLDKDQPETDQEKGWRLAMNLIGFASFDSFDQTIFDSVQRGYFDVDLINKEAKNLENKLKYNNRDNAFTKAWDRYHFSFDSNEKEVLDGLFEAFKKDVQFIDPRNADDTIGFLRLFGRNKEADELVEFYMANRDEKKEFFDPKHSPFLQVKDPKFSEALKSRLATFKDSRLPKDVLIAISRLNGWNEEDISLLANLSTDDYYHLFKQTSGHDLRIIVTQSLKFGRITGVSEDTRKISLLATEALKRIAKEESLNRERVKMYGVDIDDTSED